MFVQISQGLLHATSISTLKEADDMTRSVYVNGGIPKGPDPARYIKGVSK